MATNQHNSRIMDTATRTTGTMPATGRLVAQSPPDTAGRATPDGKPEKEPQPAGASEKQPRGGDRLDYELWRAGKCTEAARQERYMLLDALADMKSARDSQEVHLISLRESHDGVLRRYNDLYECYKTLHKRHGDLHGQFHNVCAKLKKAVEMQTGLKSAREALDKERSLKESAELQAEQIRIQLARYERWNMEEIQSRDSILEKLEEDAEKKDAELKSRNNLIEALQQDIRDKDASLARLEEALKAAKMPANALMQDHEARAAEVARLNGEVTAHKLTVTKLQDEVVILASENESATRVIESLKELQNKMSEAHAEMMQQLEAENNDLHDVLDELKGEFDDGAKEFETEKQKLQHENASLREELEGVKSALLTKFPELDANLNNLSSVLDGGETGRKGKKRRCAR